jgi:hypothetical protein
MSALNSVARSSIMIIRHHGRTEVLGKNTALRLMLRIDRRARAKQRLARMKGGK